MAKSTVKKAILSAKEKKGIPSHGWPTIDDNYPDESKPDPYVSEDYANERPGMMERYKGNSRDKDIELPNEDDGPTVKIEITPKRKRSVASY